MSDEKIPDEKLIEIWLAEKEQQHNNLRGFDQSLHQIAFAFVAAIALCFPAFLSSDKIELNALKINATLIILCQIMFFATFYALMLVRSRNLCVGHIHFISDRINEYIKNKNSETEKVLFEYSNEISNFIDHDKNSWFLSYVFALIPPFLLFMYTIYDCYFISGTPIIVTVFLIMELFTFIILITKWSQTGYAKIYKRICNDYDIWKESNNQK